MKPKLALTLPQFRDDPDAAFAVARAADEAGVDGVFAFDHMFRVGPDGRRPALDGFTLLGAVGALTTRAHLGLLVARATLRPAATAVHAYTTLARVAPGRVVAGFGAGDHESRDENESFGLPFGTLDERVGALRDAVDAATQAGLPVWVGGRHERVRRLAAESADGWNAWGGPPEPFAREVAQLRQWAAGRPVVPSWGGLVLLGRDDAEAERKAERMQVAPGTIVGGPGRVADALRPYLEAGAEWLVLGPLDSTNDDNAHIVAEYLAPLLV
jgi:alkanesulfonate monooxygenase SsuD/methylene tetrahydromethanopterin reductase-like flavin-dependent oxidoreductase (luciferase family)